MRDTEARQADELEGALDDSDRQLLEELADGIARRRLTTPAIFFLESMKPMNLVGSAAMLLLRPVISSLWQNPVKYDRVRKLLEHRGAMEVLVRRLEARA